MDAQKQSGQKKVQLIKINNKVTYALAALIFSDKAKQDNHVFSHVQPHTNNDSNINSFPTPPRPVRSSVAVRPKVPTGLRNIEAPQPSTIPSQITETKSKPIGKEKNTETPKSPPQENIITSATNEQLISFITQLVLTFYKEKSEVEILSLVKVAAERLLQHKDKHNIRNAHV